MPQLPVRAPQQTAAIDTTLDEIDTAITSQAAERIAMAYAAKRWRASLLLRLDGQFAIGVRGHGSDLENPETVRVPLGEPSLVAVAAGSRRATHEAPPALPRPHP
jgi:hypothetical protein